jgi:hypothetical protein
LSYSQTQTCSASSNLEGCWRFEAGIIMSSKNPSVTTQVSKKIQLVTYFNENRGFTRLNIKKKTKNTIDWLNIYFADNVIIRWSIVSPDDGLICWNLLLITITNYPINEMDLENNELDGTYSK